MTPRKAKTNHYSHCAHQPPPRLVISSRLLILSY